MPNINEVQRDYGSILTTPVFSHILSARTTRKKNTLLLLRSADYTENKSRDKYLGSPLAR
jgi:hypothetical protein